MLHLRRFHAHRNTRFHAHQTTALSNRHQPNGFHFRFCAATRGICSLGIRLSLQRDGNMLHQLCKLPIRPNR